MPGLLSVAFGPKYGPGDLRWTSHSPTGSGPEGSSPNEVRIGSLVSLLPVFSRRMAQDVATDSALVPLFRKASFARSPIADQPINDAGAPLPPHDSENAGQGGFALGAPAETGKPYRVLARKYRPAGF